MKKIALIYSFNTKNTSKIADKIVDEWGEDTIEKVNAEDIDEDTFLSYDQMILGVPTWFDGELPNYWDEFVPAIDDMDLKGKKVAIFGLGDQKGYPENYVDAIGIMAELLQQRGAKIIGETSTEGYYFESSKAEKNGKFIGLAIDTGVQKKKTDERIKTWIKDLKKHFE